MNEYSELNGLFDDVVEAVADTAEDVVTGVGEEVSARVDDKKQDLQDEWDDATDIEGRSKEYMDKKIDAEIDRASKNASASLVDLLTPDQVKTAVDEGKIVLSPDGKAIRDKVTGQVMTRVAWEALQKANAAKWSLGILRTLQRLRDEPAFRTNFLSKLNAAVANTTGAAKAKALKTRTAIMTWLLVNPSKNPAARTPEQNARIQAYVNEFAKQSIILVERLKADPRAFQQWEANQINLINQGGPMAARHASTLEKVRNAVKSPLSTIEYGQAQARARAEAVLTKASDVGLAKSASGFTDKELGGGLATVIGLAVASMYFFRIK